MSTKYISLGKACNVRHQIDLYIGKSETLFFDWLITDTNSVIEIFNSYKDIETILFFDNAIKNPNKIPLGVNSRILIKSLSYCESIHDLKIEYTDKDITEFLEKYKRRFARLIDYIKSDNEIIFLRYDSNKRNELASQDNNKLIQKIKAINPDCNFKVATLINKNNSDENSKEEESIIINLHNYLISEIDSNDWTASYWDWKQIFDDITVM
jgi:ABC-type molybdate transport system substrate-binding protein